MGGMRSCIGRMNSFAAMTMVNVALQHRPALRNAAISPSASASRRSVSRSSRSQA